MKGIKTEVMFVPYVKNETLESLFNKTDELMVKSKKKPLRIILLEIIRSEAKLLVSFIYEK
jgi:hypothetical protein